MKKNRLVRSFAVLCCGVLLWGECHAQHVLTPTGDAVPFTVPAIAGATAAVSMDFNDALARLNQSEGESQKAVAEQEQSGQNAKEASTAQSVAASSVKQDGKKGGKTVYGYRHIGIANVHTALNVRENPSVKARRIGRMLPDDACEVKRQEGEWSRIRSGDVTGYVMSSYLLLDDAAKERAEILMSDTVTVQADVLRVRESASINSRIITRVSNGTRLVLAELENGGTAAVTAESAENTADSGEKTADSGNSTLQNGAENATTELVNVPSTTTPDTEKAIGITADVPRFSEVRVKEAVVDGVSGETVENEKNAPIDGLGEALSVDEDVGAGRGSGPGGRAERVDEHFEENDSEANENSDTEEGKPDDGDPLEQLSENGWVEVDLNGRFGYVSTRYVAIAKELTTATAFDLPSGGDDGNDTDNNEQTDDTSEPESADEVSADKDTAADGDSAAIDEQAQEEPQNDGTDKDDENEKQQDLEDDSRSSDVNRGTNDETRNDETTASGDERAQNSGSEDEKTDTEKAKKQNDSTDEAALTGEESSDEAAQAKTKEADGKTAEANTEAANEEAVQTESGEKTAQADAETADEDAKTSQANSDVPDTAQTDDEELSGEQTKDSPENTTEASEDPADTVAGNPDGESTDDASPAEPDEQGEEDIAAVADGTLPEEGTAPQEQSAPQEASDPASYAMQFLGNPYVWGGSSLTNGADCSGFVLSVYAHFGVSLPHSSAAQANYGTPIAASEAKPGDLFFYGSGRINHVGIYIGNNQIIHASNRRTGIKISSAYYKAPVRVMRLIN